jgi:hypothetical protein
MASAFRPAPTADHAQSGDVAEAVGDSRALVPLVATLARQPRRSRSQPNSSFVTQLMAAADLLQSPPEQALAAYRSVVGHSHPPAGAGLRLRHSA